jgi:hypothetical protein
VLDPLPAQRYRTSFLAVALEATRRTAGYGAMLEYPGAGRFFLDASLAAVRSRAGCGAPRGSVSRAPPSRRRRRT